MATVKFRAEITYTRKQQELLDMLSDKSVKLEINKRIANALNFFVPMQSGALRESVHVGPDIISWGRGLPYARYQYEGEVYGPNRPITSGKRIVGWYTKPGTEKYPTGRELGVRGEWKGWIFGYTTPYTQHHWTDAYEYQVKNQTNQEITQYLKRECKARGLRT